MVSDMGDGDMENSDMVSDAVNSSMANSNMIVPPVDIDLSEIGKSGDTDGNEAEDNETTDNEAAENPNLPVLRSLIHGDMQPSAVEDRVHSVSATPRPSNQRHPEVHEFFRDGGTLTRAGRQFRQGQYTLAMSIADCFVQKKSGMIEGPTGVGKSFAYIVSAVLAARRGERTVIAVSTNGLLEQILQDIPRACELMGVRVPFASMKGRSHYICQKRVSKLSVVNTRGATKFDKLSLEERSQLDNLLDWISKGGKELTQYDMTPSNKIKRLVTITGEECQEQRANRCEYYRYTDEDEVTHPSTCNLYVAREAAMAAMIVVTNIDVLLWNCKYPGALIGEFKRVIIDEAHELNAKVRDYFSIEKGMKVFFDAADRISEIVERSSPRPNQDIADYNRNATAAYQCADQIRLLSERIHAGFEKFAIDRKPENHKGEDIEALLYECRESKAILADCEKLQAVAVEAFDAASKLREAMKSSSEDPPKDKSDVREDAEYLADVMKLEIGNFASSVVVKFSDDKKNRVALRHVPIEVGGYLRSTIYETGEMEIDPTPVVSTANVSPNRPDALAAAPSQLTITSLPAMRPKLGTVVAVSATLSPDDNWTHPRHQLAMPPDAITCRVPSPFNYRASAIWYTPAAMPEAHQRDEFNKAASAQARKLVELVGGRTLILCSARNDMEVAKQAISGLGFNVYMQDDMPPKALARAFKQDKTSCLIGSKTFGTGFDAAGDTLECVILWKLPFSKRTTVDDLLRKKLGEPIWKNGYYVPAMLLDLRQWSGRLIRRQGDIGVISILDAGAVDGRYGRRVMSAMPSGINVTRSLADVDEFLKRVRGELVPE